MKKLFLPLLICSVISAFAAEPFSIKVEKIYPPNQLPNPEFKKAADGSVPHWFFGDFSKRGIVLKPGQTIRDLYNERAPLYKKHADVTILCDGNAYPQYQSAVIRAAKRFINK